MANWRDVWKRKASGHKPGDLSLATLMELDGYDISCSAVTVDDFISFAVKLIDKLELQPGDSFLEIGCGAGALCKVMHDKGMSVSGVDYTPELVEICQMAIPKGQFVASEAAAFDLEKKDFDAVVSHSVFHYFPSDEYAVATLRRMVEHCKPGGIVALTDLHDARRKEEHEKWRREMLGEEEYNRLYKELSHSFFHPRIFEEAARDICTEYWLEDQFLPSESGRFKFNFFARK